MGNKHQPKSIMGENNLTVVVVDRFMAEEGRLPAVCMRCGQASVVCHEKRCLWMGDVPLPLSVLGTIFSPLTLIFFFQGIEWVKVKIPLCKKHRHHFTLMFITRWLVLPLLFYGLFAGLGYLLIFATGLAGLGHLSDLATILLGIAFLVGLFVVRPWPRPIRVGEITGWSVTILNVSALFVRELSRVGYLPATAKATPNADEGSLSSLPKYPGA